MKLAFEQAKLFYKLYVALLSFTNRKLEVSPEQFSGFSQYMSTPPRAKVAVRDALFAHRELIDQFIAENRERRSVDELELLGSWKKALPGTYYVLRYLKKYAVFLSGTGSPKKAFGVLGLLDPLEDVVGPDLPRLATTVLLPFQGRIIYDGIISGYNVVFGGGTEKKLNDEYNEAKAAFGIITSLEHSVGRQGKRSASSSKRTGKAVAVVSTRSAAAEAKAIADSLIEMTDGFCRQALNEEYAELCRKLITALARKRPSPLLRGRQPGWAAGVVRTIGWVNFLDDPAQSPHLKLSAIDRAFGISESTGAAKSRTIRTMFRISQFDPKWTLPSMMDENPKVWMLEIDGFVMDIREASRELQEVAFRKGLIPYIPGDRSE